MSGNWTDAPRWRYQTHKAENNSKLWIYNSKPKCCGFTSLACVSRLCLSPAAGGMSVTVSKAEGVTVFTLTSDPDSICPPLCQIFKGLCYSPTCCSVSQHLKKVQSTSQSILGVRDDARSTENTLCHTVLNFTDVVAVVQICSLLLHLCRLCI